MNVRSICAAAASAVVMLAAGVACGQPAGLPNHWATGASAAQIDQLVAPIALYPDGVLAAVLMASTYPDQVGEADRWRRANLALDGGGLDGALYEQDWDPSVKSLVALPDVLAMLDHRPAWTRALGEAFLADPAAVMDEVQRLRRAAEAAGRLASNGEITVTDRDGFVDIEPADQREVYTPTYDPDVVWGPWPFTDPPPPYDPTDFDDCVTGDFGYCWSASPVLLLVWGWDRWDWPGHRLVIDQARFTRLNGGRAPAGGDVWRHEPARTAAAAPAGAALAASGAPPATPASVWIRPMLEPAILLGDPPPIGSPRQLTRREAAAAGHVPPGQPPPRREPPPAKSETSSSGAGRR